VKIETNCPLKDRLKAFEWLYWWLDYWGHWARNGGYSPGRTPLEDLIENGDERIRSTAPRTFPRDIELLERGLARLKNDQHFLWQVLARHHIADFSYAEICAQYNIRQRGLERVLWRAFSYLEAHYREHAPDLLRRPAPIGD
jgi:hypothetical protein